EAGGGVCGTARPRAVGRPGAPRGGRPAARRRARAHAARSAGAGAHQKRRAEERQDDGALPDAGSTHCTFPVSSSTLPARSTVTLYGLPAGLLESASRIFATLAASAFIPSTVSRMSPPSGTWSPPRLTIIVAPRSPSCSAGESLATVLMMYPVAPGGRFKRSACASVSSWPSRPAQKDFFSSKSFFAVLMVTTNPSPSLPPLLEMLWLTMPMTWPFIANMGPPESPVLIVAVVWKNSASGIVLYTVLGFHRALIKPSLSE